MSEQLTTWSPIDTAPFVQDAATGESWLTECLLQVRGIAVQGMLSGGMWLRRDLEDMFAWEYLPERPTHWAPLPKPIIREPKE